MSFPDTSYKMPTRLTRLDLDRRLLIITDLIIVLCCVVFVYHQIIDYFVH